MKKIKIELTRREAEWLKAIVENGLSDDMFLAEDGTALYPGAKRDMAASFRAHKKISEGYWRSISGGLFTCPPSTKK